MHIEVNQVSMDTVKSIDEPQASIFTQGELLEGEVVEKNQTGTKVRINDQVVQLPKDMVIEESLGEKAQFQVKSVAKDRVLLQYIPKEQSAAKGADLVMGKMQTTHVDNGFELSIKSAIESVSVDKDMALTQMAQDLKETLVHIMETVTDEDIKALVKEGYDVEKITVDMFKALVDQNKIALKLGNVEQVEAAAMAKVSEFSEDFAKKFGETDTLKDIITVLQEEKQPITLKQVEKVRSVLSQYKDIKTLSEDQILNVLRNQKPFTLDEVVKVSHLPAQSVTVADDVKSLEPQVRALLSSKGIEATDSVVNLALKSIASGIPLDDQAMVKLSVLAQGNHDLSSEEQEGLIKGAVANLVEKIPVSHISLPLVTMEPAIEPEQIQKTLDLIWSIDDSDLLTVIDRQESVTLENLEKASESLNQPIANPASWQTKWLDISSAVESVMVKTDTFTMTHSVEQTLEALNGKAEAIVEQSKELQFIKAKISLEEMRLKMTYEAAHRLSDKGIDVRTQPVEEVVEALRVEERDQLSKALDVHQVDQTEGNLNEMERTVTAVQRLSSVDADMLVDVLANKRNFNLESITVKTEVHVLEQVRQVEAMKSYETMETAIRPDLGDRVEKTFDQLEALLESEGIEATEDNLRIAKALARSEMPIDQETIEAVKAMDQKVSLIAETLKPNVVASMIKEGVNPVQMSVDQIIDYVGQYEEAYMIDDSETIAEAIWSLGKTDTLSPEESDSLMGIYRMLRTISNSKATATSFLVKKGMDLSINNLFEAAKYMKTTLGRYTRVEASVDDDFGLLKEVTFEGQKVSDQVSRAFEEEGLAKTNRMVQLLSALEAQGVDLRQEAITKADTDLTVLDRFFAGFSHDKMVALQESGQLDHLEEPLSKLVDQLSQMEGLDMGRSGEKEVIQQFSEMVKMDIQMLKTFEQYGFKATASQLMTHFTIQDNPHQMAGVFNSLFERLDGAGMDSEPLRNALLQLSDSSLGDDYETLLKDIQEALKGVSNLSGDQPSGQDLQREANQTMQLIDYQQALFKEEDYYQIPVFIDNQWVQLNLFYQNHSTGGETKPEDEMDIYLYFETKTMGKVQSHMHLKDKDMQFQIYSEHEVDRPRIMAYQEEIAQVLTSGSFEVSQMSYEPVGEDSPVDQAIKQEETQTVRYVDSKFVANA